VLFVDLRDHYGITQIVPTATARRWPSSIRCAWKAS
jgi:aspartyl-tRNA synthetase